jgi:hypothetical protein
LLLLGILSESTPASAVLHPKGIVAAIMEENKNTDQQG